MILLVQACAPARLDKIPEKRHTGVVDSADLARALQGAQDDAAKTSLGNWIASNFKDQTPPSPAGFRVHFAETGPGILAPGYFDRLEPTFLYRPRGLEHHSVEGSGVPMTGLRENTGRAGIEKWYPPEGIARAVTAVAVPGASRAGTRDVEIRLLDRMRFETFGKDKAVLAADFTVPFASVLQKAGPLQNAGFNSVVRQKSEREAGFYLMEPYDPGRTPLILIHGLLSTPLAWAKLTNDLWAVPEIRSRYQIWHYLYPTNPPALYSARVMRGQLRELRDFLDPDGKDPAMRRTVVISHSMGGLLAKTLAIEPKDAFWDAIFTRPLSAMNVTPAERATLVEAFYWEPRDHVDRIIFCSVPFRGSKLASSWVGRIGNLFVARSQGFEEFFSELQQKNPGIYQPEYVTLGQGKITSVTSLSPSMKSMVILDQIPLAPGTKAHIITGSMDTIVHRSSATVADAESNIEVPAGHGSIHHPDAIREIIRILNLPAAR